MRHKGIAKDRTFRRERTESVLATTDSQQAFAVLAVEPLERPLVADQIKAMCEGIPGVNALRVDADRGRIHILYDGTATAIERVESVVRIPGCRTRLLGEIALSPHSPIAAEGSV